MIAKDHIKGQEVMPLSSKISGDLRRDEAPVGAEQTAIGSPDSEVVPKGKRRYLTAAYKARILRLADGCKVGELGALLRREGLYSSHLTKWRQDRDAGRIPGQRGRKKDPGTAGRREDAQKQKVIDRLTEKLRRAELIIEVQKKVAALMGDTLAEDEIQ